MSVRAMIYAVYDHGMSLAGESLCLSSGVAHRR